MHQTASAIAIVTSSRMQVVLLGGRNGGTNKLIPPKGEDCSLRDPRKCRRPLHDNLVSWQLNRTVVKVDRVAPAWLRDLCETRHARAMPAVGQSAFANVKNCPPRTPRCSAVKATSASQNFKNRPAVSSCRDGSAATFFLIAARPTLPFLLIESRFDGRRRDGNGRRTDDIAQSPLTRCSFGSSVRPSVRLTEAAKTEHEITDGKTAGI